MYHIYTDGAQSSKSLIGGWGVVVVENESVIEKYSGSELNTTNNRMEMEAFLKGLNILIDNNVAGKIYTDSAYISNCFAQKWYINWIKNGWVNTKKEPVKNKELWELILAAMKKLPNVEIIKVKGHASNPYNNMADKLAVDARLRRENG